MAWRGAADGGRSAEIDPLFAHGRNLVRRSLPASHGTSRKMLVVPPDEERRKQNFRGEVNPGSLWCVNDIRRRRAYPATVAGAVAEVGDPKTRRATV